MSAMPSFFTLTRTLCGACTLLLLLQGTALAEGGNAPGFEETTTSAKSQADVDVTPGFDNKRADRSALVGGADAWKKITLEKNHLDLSKADVRAEVKKDHGVSLDAKTHIAIKGDFTRSGAKNEEPLDELMVIDLEDGTISLYQKSRRLARHKNLSFPDKKELEAIGATRIAAAVSIVPDGTTQVLVWHKREFPGADKKQTVISYRATVFKAIGDHIGAPLDREIARATVTNGKGKGAAPTPTLTATLEPVQKDQFTRFLYTPLRADGTPQKSKQLQLRWNQWEGVFRHPRPVPTAPKRDKPQT